MKVDFWKSPSNIDLPVDMLVSPEYQDLVLDLVNRFNFDVETTVEDLQRDIDEERARIKAGFSYTDFNTLDEIEGWMDDLAVQYPDLVSVVKVGSSYEGRDIWALKIGSNHTDKPSVFYEGGIHAREWISPATIIYMTKLLLDGYGNDDDVTKILDELYVYMLPVYNVDGYVYTWYENGDRMWRKTRSEFESTSCRGVDPNRNWDYEWGGESNFKCSDTYQGPYAFSEIEVESVTDFIKGLGVGNVKAFIDFHSFGKMWMTPWGYTTDLPEHYHIQNSTVVKAANALEAVYGTQYRTGSISNTIYDLTGGSADWTYGVLGIVHSYAVELRGNNFIIESSEIEPSGIETFEALKVISLDALN